MGTYVYSFEDTSVIFNHPNFETYSAYGTGIGSVTVSMANDITTHDVAADLAVVVSKSVKKNGEVLVYDARGDKAKKVGTIPLVRFDNPDGMQTADMNRLIATDEAGDGRITGRCCRLHALHPRDRRRQPWR